MKPSNIHDLYKYKEAKAMLPHLNIIIHLLNLTERGLAPFKNFLPVSRILLTIKRESDILKTYRDLYKVTKSAKGKRVKE